MTDIKKAIWILLEWCILVLQFLMLFFPKIFMIIPFMDVDFFMMIWGIIWAVQVLLLVAAIYWWVKP